MSENLDRWESVRAIMTIAVLLKQVPDTTSKISFGGASVDLDSVTNWSISPYDEYALESALRLKAEGLGDIVAITCGPERSSKILTDAAAVGVDSLVHIHIEDSIYDSRNVQKLLSSAIKNLNCQVILCGKQAADTNSGSTGPGISSIMGITCVSLVSEIVADGDNLIANRSGPNGQEKIQVSKPCLFTFDKGTEELRRPNVRGIMMAKKKEVETLTPSDLDVELFESTVKFDSQVSPPEKPPGQKFEGAESVTSVVQKLREEANVI